AVGLTAYSIVKVLVPICYAIGETRYAVFSSFFSVLTNLVFNLLFVKRLGFTGLAFGTSLTAILNSALLWVLISRKLAQNGADFQDRELLRACGVYAMAALVMGFSVYALDHYLLSPLVPSNPFWFRLVRVSSGVGVGVAVYGGLGILLGLKETLEIAELIKRRWSRGK
ncbi:MAG: hypothetical protein EBX52_14890, partial [Proteobacteria bacterium]|nr:hypothetical protein [Pseudomonadota bacterium]